MRSRFHDTSRILSAGRSHRPTHRVATATSASDCRELVLTAPPDLKLLPFGAGQSLGDSCLNDGNALIVTRQMARVADVQRATGRLLCEPGVTMGALADVGLGAAAGERWFPAVFPGTTAVTVAGAIANDIHGKNHTLQGSFCHHVEELTLLRSDGEFVVCSERGNPGLFHATLGGLGLTGIIVSAVLRMRPVPGPLLLSEDLRCGSLGEAFALLLEAPNEWEYRFAWFDPFDPAGRGMFTRSRHVSGEAGEAEPNGLLMPTISRLPLPAAIGRAALWRAWYAFLLSKAPARRQRRMTYRDILAPLGQFARWNRLLGPRGLFHLQSVLPTDGALGLLQRMLTECRDADEMPWIASVKVFGARRPAGLLSFPREGVTVALDFANRGESTTRLLRRLEALIVEAGGAIYPGKDSTLTPAGFRRCFPAWESFAHQVDPRFSSSFWRRVSGSAA